MREQHATGDITNRVDTGHIGSELPVNDHETAVHFDPEPFEAEVRGVRTPTDRHQDFVGIE